MQDDERLAHAGPSMDQLNRARQDEQVQQNGEEERLKKREQVVLDLVSPVSSRNIVPTDQAQAKRALNFDAKQVSPGGTAEVPLEISSSQSTQELEGSEAVLESVVDKSGAGPKLPDLKEGQIRVTPLDPNVANAEWNNRGGTGSMKTKKKVEIEGNHFYCLFQCKNEACNVNLIRRYRFFNGAWVEFDTILQGRKDVVIAQDKPHSHVLMSRPIAELKNAEVSKEFKEKIIELGRVGKKAGQVKSFILLDKAS